MSFLKNLDIAQRNELIDELWRIQSGKCFISGEAIDLAIHRSELDIDHVIPTARGGKDDKSNFALTFSSANRSKQDSDLNLARDIQCFYKTREETEKQGRSPNLDDILKDKGGAKFQLNFKRAGDMISYSFSKISRNDIIKTPIYLDTLSKNEYFFAMLPIEYVHHDDKINPRSIGKNVVGLMSEFYRKSPQLHVALGWIDIESDTTSCVKIFDGQHKTAAQLLLGVKEIPVRVFINPIESELIQTNFRAGTTLRQVAFDKSVQRHLGNTIFKDRVVQYQKEHGLDEEDCNFSERDLLNHFKAETRSMKGYIIDVQRYHIKNDPDNKLTKYIEDAGKSSNKPVSYSTVEKTFFSFFINGEPLTTNISYGLEDGKNFRKIEQAQIIGLMNVIAEEILIDKFDFALGTNIESKLAKGEHFPPDHVRACRMCREETLNGWLNLIKMIVRNYFAMVGIPVEDRCLFGTEFPSVLNTNIKNAVRNIANLPLWKNTETSIFAGKRVGSYWLEVFQTGKTSDGVIVLAEPVNLIEIIKE